MTQMDGDVERLAYKIVDGLKSIPNDRRMLVAIAGPPGSGKSTLAYPLTAHLNSLLLHTPEKGTTTDERTGLTHVEQDANQAGGSTLHQSANGQTTEGGKGGEAGKPAGTSEEVAICVGLDGWHYSRAELDEFDDPREAHYRRGAAFTFNLPSYISFLTLLSAPISPLSPTSSIPFPTFSHALKDPLPSPVGIMPHHRIIIIEGLYTMLDRPGWRECAEMMDLRVFVECDEAVCRSRVVRRNWEAGIVSDLKECEARVDASDMVNGTEVRTHLYKPTDVITPKDEPEAHA